MPTPVEKVDGLIHIWHQSPEHAIRRLQCCDHFLLQHAESLESRLHLLLRDSASSGMAAETDAAFWRWSTTRYALFWVLVAVLCFGALAAGYFLAISG
ncbi:MAG: hypothetical protein ACUVS7_16845 [Bryobacteraceae bacterium]